MREQSFSGKTGMVSGQDIMINHVDFHVCNYPLSLIIVGFLLFCVIGIAIGYQLHAYMIEPRQVITRSVRLEYTDELPSLDEGSIR